MSPRLHNATNSSESPGFVQQPSHEIIIAEVLVFDVIMYWPNKKKFTLRN